MLLCEGRKEGRKKYFDSGNERTKNWLTTVEKNPERMAYCRKSLTGRRGLTLHGKIYFF
jgi:hypothetical protein